MKRTSRDDIDIQTKKVKVEEESTFEDALKYVLMPHKDKEVWNMYKQQQASVWFFEEIDLTQDKKDWNKLSSEEQYFIKHVLAFFTSADLIVADNLVTRFIQDAKSTEEKAFYSLQNAMEQVHEETYSELLDFFVEDQAEKAKLFRAIIDVPSIRKKAKWVEKYITSNESYAIRLLAFIVCEAIFFSASFCAIFWLKKRGLLPGLCFSNELISQDEFLHVKFGCLKYLREKDKPSTEEIHNIFSDGVQGELEYVQESLPVNLIGMNSDQMSQHVKFVCDRTLQMIQVPKLYNVEEPYAWMENQGISGKTNFFEKRVGEYSRINLKKQPSTNNATNGFEIKSEY